MPDPEKELSVALTTEEPAATGLPPEQPTGLLPEAVEHLAGGVAADVKVASEIPAEHPAMAMARFCDAVRGICSRNGLVFEEILPRDIRRKLHKLVAETGKLQNPEAEF